MRYGEPFDFTRVYASSGGPQIWKVIHEADKLEEDRTNPPSWIALLGGLSALEQYKTGTLPLEGDVTKVPHKVRKTYLRPNGWTEAHHALSEVVTNTAERTWENFDDCRLIPYMGMHHPTYEAARLAVEVGAIQPSSLKLLEIHETLAKRERSDTAFFTALSKAEKNLQPVADAINDYAERGLFPMNVGAFVEHTGGGCMSVTTYVLHEDGSTNQDGPYIMVTDMNEDGTIDIGVYRDWEDQDDMAYFTTRDNRYPDLDLYHEEAPGIVAQFVLQIFTATKVLGKWIPADNL